MIPTAPEPWDEFLAWLKAEAQDSVFRIQMRRHTGERIPFKHNPTQEAPHNR